MHIEFDMLRKLFGSYKLILIYGVSLAVLLFLMRWLELRLLVIDHATELYAGALALIFTALGVWLALNLAKPKTKTVVIEKQVYVESTGTFERNDQVVEELGLSKRELEVLELMASGLSNSEIADKLFVSLNTIKTHTSKLFEKLEVNRRTQAIESAKRKGIIPL